MKPSRRDFLMAAGMVGAAAKVFSPEARGAQAPQTSAAQVPRQQGASAAQTPPELAPQRWGDPYEYLPQARAEDHRELLPPEATNGPWRNLRAVQQKRVIDYHAHSSETRTQALTYEGQRLLHEHPDVVDFTESLVESMDRHGIAKAYLTPVGIHDRTQFPELIRSRERYPGRFEVRGGLRGLRPRPVGEAAAVILKEQFTKYGAKGVGEGAFPRSDNLADVKPFMDVVMDYDVPVLNDGGGWGANSGGGAYACGWHSLEAFGNLVAKWPGVTWIMIDSGGSFDHLDGFEAIRVAYSYENVYLDTTKTSARIITEAVRGIGAERVIYGSDWNRPEMKSYGPFHYRMGYQHWWGLNQVALADITEDQRDMILYKNAERLSHSQP